MSRRKGISFTLTIVVAGVILLMTALSIITLGGSSISSFFGTAGEQQTEALVEQACNDKARQIQQNYCDQYVATGQVEHEETGGTEASGTCENTDEDHPANEETDCSSGGSIDDSDDHYSLISGVECGETSPSRVIPPNSGGTDGVNYYEDGMRDGDYYFERTASVESCSWEGNAEGFAGSEIEPTVTVEGSEYNCLNKGYLQPSCPVQ